MGFLLFQMSLLVKMTLTMYFCECIVLQLMQLVYMDRVIFPFFWYLSISSIGNVFNIVCFTLVVVFSGDVCCDLCGTAV